MEQLRTVFRFCQRQHFWLLSGLIIVLGIASWFLGASTVKEQFAANEKKYKASVSSVQTVNSKNPHPNDSTITGQRAEADIIRQVTLRSWKQLYARQQATVLKWPKPLGGHFLDRIESYKFGGDDISSRMREDYWTYIKERARQLLVIVDAQDPDKVDAFLDGGPGRGAEGEGAGRPAMNDKFLVIWEDYPMLEETLKWDRRPSSIRVWITQEDLWVYETMLQVIANVNKASNATGNHDAPISIIHSMNVGMLAAASRQTKGRIMRFSDPAAATAGAPGGGETSRAAPDFEGSPEPGGPGGEGEGSDGGELALLTIGRYLDDAGKPIAEAGVGTDTQFKRLPVRMHLKMNQSYLPALLVECSNATLPIEIEQIRVNVKAGSTSGGMGMGGRTGGGGGRGMEGGGMRGGGGRGREGGGMPGGGGHGGRPSAGRTGGGGAQAGETTDLKADPNIVEVILHGTIFIYNKPNEETLKLPWDENADTGGAEDGSFTFSTQSPVKPS